MEVRQIILDTETTGLSPQHGDKLVEIGCIELVDRKPTGEHYHQYINPLRPMGEGAFKVHGLSDDFLRPFPAFPFIAEDFLKFIHGAEIIAHNAPFDIGFLNAELDALGWGYQIPDELVLDTYQTARLVLPGQRHRLDDLVAHYGIKIKRELHGALLDARILAEVYLKLTQEQLDLKLAAKKAEKAERPPLPKTVVIRADEEEQAAHDAFMKLIQGGQ